MLALSFVLVAQLNYPLFYAETERSKAAGARLFCAAACTEHDACGGFAYDEAQVRLGSN